MDKISFQGNTQLFFDPKKYKECIEKTTKQTKHIAHETTRRIPRFSIYTAEVSSDKVILYMGNEKNGLLTTVSTKESNPEIIDNIEMQANNLLQRAKEKLTVWIIGGDAISGKNGSKTIKTVNEIAERLCDRPDIDASILAGTRDITNKVAFKLSGGKLNVLVGKDVKPVEINEEGLAKHFDIVELNNVTAG